MAWSWANIDWTATGTVSAAWAQALLTVAAVFITVRLQDRAATLRESASRNELLEGVASTALYANRVIETLDLPETANSAALIAVDHHTRLLAAARAVAAIEPARLGDIELTDLYLRFEQVFREAERRLERIGAEAKSLRGSGSQIPARGRFGQLPTEMFNAAAAVERRVAGIVGRRARI